MTRKLFALLFLAAVPAAAAQNHDSVVLRAAASLRAGTLIMAELQGLDRARGLLQGAGLNGIEIADASGARVLPLADVSRLWQRKRAVGAGAVVGGVIGAGTGVFFGLIATALCEYDCASTGSGIAIGGLLGAAFGAGTGAVIGAAIPRWSTVYRGSGGDGGDPGDGRWRSAQEPILATGAPAPRRHIGEISLLAIGGGGGREGDAVGMVPPSRGAVFGGELGLAFRAGAFSLGPETSIMRGGHRLWTLGGMMRFALDGDRGANPRRASPHVTAGLGAFAWRSGFASQTLLTATFGGGVTLPAGWRLEARWHPSLQNTGLPKPVLVTVAAGYRVTW